MKQDLIADVGGANMDHATRACLRMWSAVFLHGLSDSAAHFFSTGQDDWWIDRRNNAQHPGSVMWLCDLFGIDPDRARSTARANYRKLARSGK